MNREDFIRDFGELGRRITEEGEGFTEAEVELSVRGVSEMGVSEMGVSEVGLSEAGLSEERLSEVGLSERGLSEERLSEGVGRLAYAAGRSIEVNPWFTEYHIREAVCAIAQNYLQSEKLRAWLSVYPDRWYNFEKEITVVMAGNVPLVGYHDYLSVLASGRRVAVKLSSKDPFLLPALHEWLCSFAPAWRQVVRFVAEVPAADADGLSTSVADGLSTSVTDGLSTTVADGLSTTDAGGLISSTTDGLIATGSDVTAEWFATRYPRLPKIIRGHCVSVAVIHEAITEAQISALHRDMFLYFGLGCRSVVRLFVPQGFDLLRLTAFEQLPKEASHTGFRNVYLRQKALLTLQGHPFIDGGFFLLQPADDLNPPLSTIFYTRYTHINEVVDYIQEHQTQLQCVVGVHSDLKKSINFGSAQNPQLWDYANEIDTLNL